jgi:hypothetical protein
MERNGRKEKKDIFMIMNAKTIIQWNWLWVKEGQAGALSLAASLW